MDFDLDNILYFFTAGRYEFRNKGIDMYLEALSSKIHKYIGFHHCNPGLNKRLQHVNSPVTVVAFIIMPAHTNNYNVEALKGQALNKQLKDAVNQITQNIGKRVFDCALK